MTGPASTIYLAPDIRKQSLAEAEAFLQAKRLRRMVVVLNAQEKLSAKLSKLQVSEAEKFRKRMEKVEAAKAKVLDALDALERSIDAALSTANGLNNIEQGMLDL